MDYIKLALQIATNAHKEQKDKAGVDYINHPIFVSSLCVNAEEKIVALLHDVVEDTEITLENLKEYGFSDEIITAVDCITKRHNEPIENYLHRVKTNELARIVKLADLKHNMDLSRLKNPTEKDYLRLNKYKSEYNFLYKN